MPYIAHKTTQMMLELYFIGARPPIVRNLLRVNEAESVNYYKKALNRSPPRGQLPCDIFPFLRTLERRKQAAVLVGYMRKISPYSICLAEQLLITYKLYSAIFKNKILFDFNRVWLLHRKIVIKEIGLYCCTYCQTVFIEDYTQPSTHRACPFCRSADNKTNMPSAFSNSHEIQLPQIFNHQSPNDDLDNPNIMPTT